MSERPARWLAPAGLVIGAVLGIAGTFVSSDSLRGLLWGLDGVALVVAAAILAIEHGRRGNDVVAAGYLVFVAGETLIVAGSAMDLVASAPLFGAGAALWAAALALVSAPRVLPLWVRSVGVVAALLFAVVAVQIFTGRPMTALSRPLPFFAYPFLAASLLGWAWAHRRGGR